MPTGIYHERQTMQLCALHALNNLFQESQAYTKEQLDEICNNLTPNVWINPHRSILGLGNYDVNVLITALQKRNYEAIWFDKRKDPSCIDLESVLGFILNVPSDLKFGVFTVPIRRRHWIAVRNINGLYYNLDSKLTAPESIGNESNLMEFLRKQLQTNERELFVIVPRSNDDEQSNVVWLKDAESTESSGP